MRFAVWVAIGLAVFGLLEMGLSVLWLLALLSFCTLL